MQFGLTGMLPIYLLFLPCILKVLATGRQIVNYSSPIFSPFGRYKLALGWLGLIEFWLLFVAHKALSSVGLHWFIVI